MTVLYETKPQGSVAADAGYSCPPWCVGGCDEGAVHVTEFEGPDLTGGLDDEAIARLVQDGDAAPEVELGVNDSDGGTAAVRLSLEQARDLADLLVYLIGEGIPVMPGRSNEDAAARLAAVRGVLSAFDWESDDRQYALEEIERVVTAGDEETTPDPNSRRYALRWNDTGAPYVSAGHRMEFALADAMRIADYEPVTVVDAGTGRVLWIGSEATRGAK